MLGLFSWVTVTAHALSRGQGLTPRQAAWCPKTLPTFMDALAFVRITLWTGKPRLSRFRPLPEREKPQPPDPEHLWGFPGQPKSRVQARIEGAGAPRGIRERCLGTEQINA